MIALTALLPCAVVIAAILWLRLSGVVAAGAAALTALLIWGSGLFTPPEASQFGNALIDTAILGLLVAAIVLPGILFVETSDRAGAPRAIGSVMRKLQLDAPRAAIVIAAGFGVMVESLTGYGVSLLVTVPLLISLVERRLAIALALIGMSLMPWGALSVAAHLGAELAAVSLADLSTMIWRVSGPVAFVLPLLCLKFVPRPTRGDVAFALVAGLLLSGAIGLASYTVGIEIAGVAGGIAVIALAMAIAPKRDGLGAIFAGPALRSYFLLILAVMAQKLLVAPLGEMGVAPALSSGRVTFTVLTSPGVALLLTSCVILMAPSRKSQSAEARPPLAAILWRRGWRPLASTFLFLMAARMLVEIDAIASLGSLLSGLGVYPALGAVTLLGAASGFVTGSGVAGNALFMPSAAATGTSFDAVALFSALQHGAAGHVAMAALPVAAILLAALPDRTAEDDRVTMRTGLQFSLLFVLILIGAGALLTFFGLHRL